MEAHVIKRRNRRTQWDRYKEVVDAVPDGQWVGVDAQGWGNSKTPSEYASRVRRGHIWKDREYEAKVEAFLASDGLVAYQLFVRKVPRTGDLW